MRSLKFFYFFLIRKKEHLKREISMRGKFSYFKVQATQTHKTSKGKSKGFLTGVYSYQGQNVQLCVGEGSAKAEM